MEIYEFVIGNKHGRDIDWRDSNRLVRMIEQYQSGGLVEHEESRRVHIDKKDDNVPYRLLLIAKMNEENRELFKREIYRQKYEILEERVLEELEVVQ